jgi:thioredoxin-related protein
MKTIHAIVWALCFVATSAAHAKTPDGWPFVEYTEAIKLSQKSGKPMFVLFGFPTCPYCEYLNKHTFSS